MSMDDPARRAAALAASAGLKLPDARLAQVAFGLAGVAAAAATLARHDYGALEPASRFVAPPSR